MERYLEFADILQGSKRDKRLQNKKRKAAALLQLVRDTQQSTNESTGNNNSEVDQSFAKRPKISEDPCSVALTVFPVQDNEEADVIKEKKRILAERRKILYKPQLCMLLENVVRYNEPIGASGTVPAQTLPPLYMMDLQHLLLIALLNNVTTYKPRWCCLFNGQNLKSIMLVVLDGISIRDLEKHRDSCLFLWDNFESIQMVSPAQYGGSVMQELFSVPIRTAQVKKYEALSSVTVDGSTKSLDSTNFFYVECNRMDLLLTPDQMIMEKYPLPATTIPGLFDDFVYSKEQYSEVTESSPLFALDCEMCITSLGKHELTRVSLVNEQQEVIYDTLVKPYKPVTNYLTRFSGITEKLLEPVSTRLEDVQNYIHKALPKDAILCGQGLNFDLKALKMFHPYVIDTSVIFNMTGDRNKKSSLKGLVYNFLQRTIQNSKNGHCSIEDARAALELVLLKLKKGLQYGDATFQHVKQLNLAKANSDISESATFVFKEGLESVTERQETERNLKSESAADDAESRRNLFFKRWKNCLPKSVFELLHNQNKSACIIDTEEIIAQIPSNAGVVTYKVDSDKMARKIAKLRVRQEELVWMGCPDVRQAVQHWPLDVDRRTAVENLNQRIQKLKSHMPENVLFTVLCTGRQNDEDGIQNAAAFLTVT